MRMNEASLQSALNETMSFLYQGLKNPSNTAAKLLPSSIGCYGCKCCMYVEIITLEEGIKQVCSQKPTFMQLSILDSTLVFSYSSARLPISRKL